MTPANYLGQLFLHITDNLHDKRGCYYSNLYFFAMRGEIVITNSSRITIESIQIRFIATLSFISEQIKD